MLLGLYLEERQANVSGKREEDRWQRERRKLSHRRRENGETGGFQGSLD